MFQRALIIGCPGAGKSTFARALRDQTGLPLHYLDLLWHRPDQTNLSRAEFDRRLTDILAGDRWIIDGNYIRTLEHRLNRCDEVFLLDYPLDLCLQGAASRIGRKREDLPWVETEMDEEFRRFIEDFPRDQLPQIYSLLERYRESCQVYVLHTREEAAACLAALP